MLKIVRFFLGYVTFSVSGKFLERFINLSANSGVCLFDVKKGKDFFECSSIFTEYKEILKIAGKSRTEVKIKNKVGLPFLIKKYKNRYGLFLGLLLFVFIQFFLSLFIWDVSVSGNNNLDEEEILSLVSNLGVKNGVLKSRINTSFIENCILNEIADVSWVSVNLIGSRVNLEIKEKTKAPNLVLENSPCNIVASSDARVTRMEVYKGTTEVKNGDAVTKGQILVNGIVEDAFGKSKACCAEAKIFATLKKEIKEEVNLKDTIYVDIDKKVKRKSVLFFNLKIPLSFVPVPKGDYRMSAEIKDLVFLGSKLPVTFYKETWNKFLKKNVFLTLQEAKNVAINNIKRRENLELRDAKILEYKDDFKIYNKKLCFVRTYSVVKDIAKKVPLVFS